MDFMSKVGTVPMDKFNKCGEVYRSPVINGKQYMFLSCIYCKDISWELEKFLQHLDDTHRTLNNINLDMYKIEFTGTSVESRIEYSPEYPPSSLAYENDPLNEKHCDCNEPSSITIKMEEPEATQPQGDVPKTDTGILSSTVNQKNELLKYDNNNSSKLHEDSQPDRLITEYENTCEYFNQEYTENEDVSGDTNNIVFESKLAKDNKKTSLKHFTKNREFIKAIINGYQKQYILWDSAYKSKKSYKSEKQEAIKTILRDINEKFNITATQQQIELFIKRLKLRFLHHLRLKDKTKSYKTLWFFELLSFLKPHLNGKKLNMGICTQLSHNQLLKFLKLLKENECFWNENNIYHTSIIKKQEILKRITNDFSKMCNLKDINVDIMQGTIDEIIEMAREEKTKKFQHVEIDRNDEYESDNRFYKDIQFLLPHVGPFKCKYCAKTLSDIYAYKFHISRHEGTKPFKCMQCPRELKHKKEFICHLRRHTKECPFQCNVCDKSFPSQKEWHRHIIKHGSKPYVCELCADSFYTQHQLTNHMKNHNNIRDHVCPECGKGFTHRGLLRQHLQTHNKTKCFCTLCDNIYSNPRSLRKHYVRVHELGQSSAASKTQYNCQICKITFSTIYDAKQHRKEHKQSKPTERKHVCDICGHNFAYPRNLADHKKTHSNIRDQVCDVCGKAFTNPNLLNQHKNVHAGEKFLCKACGKDYAHYRGLCRHISNVHGTNIRDLDALLQKQKLVSSLQ